MCGIFSIYGKTEMEYIKVLVEHSIRRGSSGFGVYINGKLLHSKSIEEIISFTEKNLQEDNIILFHSRAIPETEVVDESQPIANFDEGVILVHNGGICDAHRRDFDYNYKTKLDSEILIASYLSRGRDIWKALELEGSFAFAMLDTRRMKLMYGTSFLPLHQLYIKDYGLYISSFREPLDIIREDITGSSVQSISLWEYWWQEEIPYLTAVELDLNSNLFRRKSFRPKHIAPRKDNEKGKICLVSVSGGIDSTLTAYLLKLIGEKVVMVHFSYGQKGQKAERLAVSNFSKKYGIDIKFIDLNFMRDFRSALISKDIDETLTEGELIKSVWAWTPARNLVFTSILLSLAENYIMDGYSEVWISAGWFQLSEEIATYPDNSYWFYKLSDMMKDIGCIYGDRIRILPLFQNLTKTEEWYIAKLLKLSSYDFVSCDNPAVLGFEIYHCGRCGSEKLSKIAMERVGMRDERKYLFQPKYEADGRIEFSIDEILRKFPSDISERLRPLLEKVN